jgi:hypothetical protein
LMDSLRPRRQRSYEPSSLPGRPRAEAPKIASSPSGVGTGKVKACWGVALSSMSRRHRFGYVLRGRKVEDKPRGIDASSKYPLVDVRCWRTPATVP